MWQIVAAGRPLVNSKIKGISLLTVFDHSNLTPMLLLIYLAADQVVLVI